MNSSSTRTASGLIISTAFWRHRSFHKHHDGDGRHWRGKLRRDPLPAAADIFWRQSIEEDARIFACRLRGETVQQRDEGREIAKLAVLTTGKYALDHAPFDPRASAVLASARSSRGAVRIHSINWRTIIGRAGLLGSARFHFRLRGT